MFYELLRPSKPGRAEAALRAAVVSAAAYVTDYHLVPRRLTPGFELRLRRLALLPIYVSLALGLMVRDLSPRLAAFSR